MVQQPAAHGLIMGAHDGLCGKFYDSALAGCVYPLAHIVACMHDSRANDKNASTKGVWAAPVYGTRHSALVFQSVTLQSAACFQRSLYTEACCVL